MYGDGPERIDLRALERVALCPAAASGRTTRMPRSTLDRWMVVRDACASWHTGTDPQEVIDQQFGVLDAVQREIVTELFMSYVSLMGASRDRATNVESDPVVVPHPDIDASVSASVTFTLSGDDGPELVKLRTGRNGSSRWEKAVLLTAKDPHDTVVEVMTAAGTVDHAYMDDADRDAALAEIFAAWEAQRSDTTRRGTRPGYWCFTCPRPAQCGQYPVIDGARVYASTRTIRLPKTWATTLRTCHRKVAWKQLHGITEDGEDLDDERRSRGVRFHDIIGTALTSEDPQAAFEVALRAVPESEILNMEWLWERHLELEREHEHPITVVETEYQVGATAMVRGKTSDSRGRVREGQPVAVVFMGRADATGREADGTPAVIEFRTGAGAAEINQLEVDIYAVGVALLTGRDRVAVHLHQLGLADGPVCVREFYDVGRIAEAIQRLEDPATTVANWHPDDATDPRYTVGPWCDQCVFRLRCTRHR